MLKTKNPNIITNPELFTLAEIKEWLKTKPHPVNIAACLQREEARAYPRRDVVVLLENYIT